MSEESEFSIEEINTYRVSEPVKEESDEYAMMTRGAERVKNSLLEEAIKRPLTETEVDQLFMLLNAKKPTKEFAKFVLSQGREE